MKYALALIALVTALAFAGGEFTTGCADTFKISGYTKAWFYMWGEDYADPANGFRFYNWTALTANLNDWVRGSIGLEFKSWNGLKDLQVCDGWLEADIVPEFSIRAGQFKVPFGYAYNCSGGGIYFLDRAVMVTGVNVDSTYQNYDFMYFGGRDIGVNAHAQFDMVGLDLGYFNGMGAYGDSDTTVNMQFVAGLTLDATDWLTFGAGVSMIGQPEFEDTSGTTESWSATGIDAYLLVDYPVSPTFDLVFQGEFLNAGVVGPDISGVDKEAGMDFYAMLGGRFGLEGGFLSAIMPAVRYESLDPMEYVLAGGTGAEDKVTIIDFCVNFYNGANHDIQLGGRNWGFENSDPDSGGVEGYTDMYLGWRMRF